ncbi:MAG: metal ABC transporter permease [Ignavibacteriae bacterium]|nr:metal ABC transporter permease [Ignavibacteriota bacterium]
MIEAFTQSFMLRAMLAGILVGFMSSYFGVFIVQRRMSFMGSGLAHAAFGGVALGILLNTEPLWIAIPFTIIASIGITLLKDKTKLGSDTSIGILFAISVALGIIFLSLKRSYTADAFAYLFGSILSVQTSDLYVTIILGIITLLTLFRYWSRWAYTSFDRELASTDRIPVTTDDYVLNILLAITIVISVKLVGIILVAAFLVIPAASARLVAGTFFRMTIISIALGVISSIAGLFTSYLFDLPSGATIILVQAAIFLISVIYQKTSAQESI